ncbi:alpha/beta hydrolase [Phormidesmis priestleyi]|uniref:alpha/beta fold hydrolase n=1 Tax=Phormidesmis priestleyi TaxID=268141 RepID=UPI002F90BC00
MMPTIHVMGSPHAYELTAPTNSPEVLVFIHGWLLSRHYWQPIVDQLAIEYTCLSYDLRGFGDSQPCQSKSGYSLQAYAQDLGDLLEQLGIENAWLVGHSLGGSVALWGADLLSDRVKGVICVNAGGGIYLKEQFERFRNAGRQIVKLRPRWLPRVPFLERLFRRASVVQTLDRAWAQQRLIDFVAADSKAALGALLDSTTEAEVHCLPQVVARLKQPVYFIAGAQDPIMELKYVQHLASFHRLFGCCGDNVFEILECGHMAMIEQTDEVAERIRAILKKGEEYGV